MTNSGNDSLAKPAQQRSLITRTSVAYDAGEIDGTPFITMEY